MRVRQSGSMKGKLIVLTILLVLFLLFIAVKYLLLDRENSDGAIRVVSYPPSTVFINNTSLGRTPFEVKMKTGEHLVKLIPNREENATPSAQWEGTVKVNKNALSYVNVDLGDSDATTAVDIYTIEPMSPGAKSGDNGELFVDSEPPGAIVNVDNDEKGIASIVIAPILGGNHEVSLHLPGFVRRTRSVNVVAGRRVNALFKLAVDKLQQERIASLSAPRKIATESAAVATPAADLDTAPPPGTKQVLIRDTPTGWLRVRAEASIAASEEARLDSGTRHTLLEQKPNWYRIQYEAGKDGWIAAEYAEIIGE